MTVDDYLANIPNDQSLALQHVRDLIHQTVPDVVESIRYGMPACTYRGKPLMYFAAFTHHLSIFPTAEPNEALRHKLTDFKTSKGTIQFQIERPIPDELIQELLLYRKKIIDDVAV